MNEQMDVSGPNVGRTNPARWRRPNNPWTRVASLLGALLVLSAGGCNSYQENQWYFAAAQVPAAGPMDPDNPVRAVVDPVKLKFYRVTLRSYSINGNAELLTGTYPVEPLHELFGEVTKPQDKQGQFKEEPPKAEGSKSTTTRPEGDTAAMSHKDGGQLLFQCNTEVGRLQLIPQDARFTIFYGVNAEAMADQVKQFADSDETGALMGRLLLAASGAGAQKLTADRAEERAKTITAAVTTDIPKALDEQAQKIAKDKDEDAKVALGTVAQSILKSLNGQELDPKSVDWAEQAKKAAAEIRKTIGGEQ